MKPNTAAWIIIVLIAVVAVTSAGCLYPVAGTMHLVNDDVGLDALIDFGDGTCDSIATVTIDGETREVDIREWLKTRRYRNQ